VKGLDETFARTVAVLEAAGVPYMVVGSVASAFHGMARSTQDLDVVVELRKADLDRVVGAFQNADFYVAEDAAASAVRIGGMFNVVDNHTSWKVDLVVRKSRPFSQSEFSRRVRGRVLDVEAWVASAEDTVLAKLEWSARGESERQLRDVAGIVTMQGDALDTEYIAHWANELGVTEQWKAVRPDGSAS
jgi:hypothetical protein